jgi:hypothetical protein
MNKKEAIQFLKERADELPKLRSLPHNNKEYSLWYHSIEDVLEVVFGEKSTEFQRLMMLGSMSQ